MGKTQELKTCFAGCVLVVVVAEEEGSSPSPLSFPLPRMCSWIVVERARLVGAGRGAARAVLAGALARGVLASGRALPVPGLGGQRKQTVWSQLLPGFQGAKHACFFHITGGCVTKCFLGNGLHIVQLKE